MSSEGWLESAYWWLSQAKYHLKNENFKECKKCIRICKVRIMWTLEELIKEKENE